MPQRYKKFNTYNKKFTESKLFNMQEKYNKKLLTMKMLKTQKWAGLKKKAGRWQFQGSFRAVAVSVAVKKRGRQSSFTDPLNKNIITSLMNS